MEKMKEARKKRKEEREVATDRGEERRWKREVAVAKNSLPSARETKMVAGNKRKVRWRRRKGRGVEDGGSAVICDGRKISPVARERKKAEREREKEIATERFFNIIFKFFYIYLFIS